MLEGLQDGLPQASSVLDKLREDLDESSPRREEFREELEESSQRLEESSQRLKDSSQRRFELKSARSGLRAITERLPRRRQEGGARAEGQLASRFRLLQTLSRRRKVRLGLEEEMKGLLERRCGAQSVVSRSRKGRDCFLERL